MAASAIKFVFAHLFREAKACQSEDKVLTGELGPGGPEWAKKAAKISQPNEGGRRWMLWSQHCTTCDGGEDCSNEDFGRC